MVQVKLRDGVTMKRFSQASFGGYNATSRFRSKHLRKSLQASELITGGLVVSVLNKNGVITPLAYDSVDRKTWEVIEE